MTKSPFSKENLPLSSFLVLAIIGLLQIAAFVFDWHLPWSASTGIAVVGIAYILTFLWLYRARPPLRAAVSRSIARPALWLGFLMVVVVAWLALLTWLQSRTTASLAAVWDAMPPSSPATPPAVEVTTSPTPSPPESATPLPYIQDDFTSQRVNSSTWQDAMCPPGSLQVLYDRLRISLSQPSGAPLTSCVLDARLRGATVLRAELHLTVRDHTNDLGYAGVFASCGGSIASFLLTGSELQISRTGETTSQLLFIDDLPTTKTLVIEWRENTMTFSSLEDNISQDLPCSSPSSYIRIGATAAGGGVVEADLLDFRLWAITPTPTP